MLSEMQPPPTQALKGYVELLAVAELHSTTTFIVMIIAHNPAIVKHFPKYIVAPGRKTRKNPGAQQKEKNMKNRFTLQYYNSTTRINCQPLFSKIFPHG